jgi:hypothetical protein
MSQILDKIGIPKPFLPTPDNTDVFRQRWSAGTTHFVNSPIAKQALASGGGINWSQHDVRIPARDGDGIGIAHQQWSSSTAVDGVWEALTRRSSSASFGVKGWG